MIPLKSSRDFALLKNKGRRSTPASWLVIQWQKNEFGCVRLGFTVPRYVGNAVVRNRLRRWAKEFVREWARPVAADGAMDLNLFFRRQDPEFYRRLEHKAFAAQLEAGLKKVAAHG